MPVISVIVPVYMVEPFLCRCVDSILKQTYVDFELILVDDGSPDNCGLICDEYEEKDDRVHVIHKKNSGLSAARNTGINWVQKNSNSEWITFVDSDDWIHPDYLSLLYQAVISTNISVAIGRLVRIQQTDDAVKVLSRTKPIICETEEYYCTYKVNATVACGKLYRKEDFLDVRFPEGKIHEDEYTTYKILFRYPEIAVVDLPIYFYYQNPQSIMGSGWNPKHISECDGMLEQVRFFAENGFEKAAEYVSRLYLISIYKNLQKAETDERYATEKEKLQSRLKKELRRYGKQSGVSIKNSPWLYYEAHPILTLPYRAYRKLFKRADKKVMKK